jgi:hypothetical protein
MENEAGEKEQNETKDGSLNVERGSSNGPYSAYTHPTQTPERGGLTTDYAGF